MVVAVISAVLAAFFVFWGTSFLMKFQLDLGLDLIDKKTYGKKIITAFVLVAIGMIILALGVVV